MMVRPFPREMASLPALVEFVQEFLAAEGLAQSRAFELDLVIEELFTNLVKYARGERGDVDVGLARDAERVVITLREYGAELHDPTARPEIDVHRPIDERIPGGLGVHLVRRMSEDFRYEWHGGIATTTVTMRAKD